MCRPVMYFTLVIFLTTVSGISQNRDGRWFNQETKTVTKIVHEKRIVTEPTPSSCVVVQTSLPPCRHLRSISPTQTMTIPRTKLADGRDQSWRPILHASYRPINRGRVASTPTEMPQAPGSWSWNIFNLGAREVTVTKVVHDVITSKYMDPNTVVTFSVKGCRPSRLPFDLPECQNPITTAPISTSTPVATTPSTDLPFMGEKGVIVMAPIQFVTGLEPAPSPKVEKEKLVEQFKEVNGTITETPKAN